MSNLTLSARRKQAPARSTSRSRDKQSEHGSALSKTATNPPDIPAYLQAKLKVSHPQDAEEQQADKVAGEVRRALHPSSASSQSASAGGGESSRGSLEPAITPLAESGLSPKLFRAASDEKLEDTSAEVSDKVGGSTVGNRDDHSDPRTVPASIAQRIRARHGRGMPLEPDLRARLETQLEHDLSAVRIHTDAEADAMCMQMHARAFTVGNDIYFTTGSYAPASDTGLELLAHELTHVVQQGKNFQKVQRATDCTDNEQADSGSSAYQDLITVDIPAPKVQHREIYQSWATADRLKRPAAERIPRRTNQIQNWNKDIAVNEEKIKNKLENLNITVPENPETKISLSMNGRTRIEKTLIELIDLLKIPTWDRAGSARRFQVDHMVEYQTASEDGNVDEISNYELFDPYLNRSSGGAMMVSIQRKVQNYLSTIEPYSSREGTPKAKWAEARTWLGENAICFKYVHAGTGISNVEIGSWSREDIELIRPLDNAHEILRPEKGKNDEFVLASGSGGFQLARISHSPQQSEFTILKENDAKAIAGLHLQQINLNGSEREETSGVSIGTLEAELDLPEAWSRVNDDSALSLILKSSGQYIGYPHQIPPLILNFKELSPVQFETVQLQNGELSAEGTLTPSLPILNAPITVRLRGNDLTFSLDYGADEINLPIPRTNIDDAYVSVFYSTVRGLGLGGDILFSVEGVGNGELAASVSTTGGPVFEGSFNFDSSLFDRAQVRAWWRNGEFGAEGTIGIDTPNKVRGIESATATVSVDAGRWSFIGSAALSVPGVDDASIAITQNENGLVIAGDVQLAANPAIRSGSIHVECEQSDGNWRLAASGTAQPAIPGINSELTVSYDDGAFDARFSGAFSRGMLSGQITAGATNRSIDDNGQPSDEPIAGAPLIVYGRGSATVRIAPWLQGTAGLRIDPDGEITVSGEIGLPDQLEIFPQRRFDRPLFGLATQIPIIPGIVAEVGGNLSLNASIGPGAIDQLRIGIEYNPAHEENTHVTGGAHLNVPAQAGLRLGARAGVGLGITGASATGGLEIGGTLGIAGAAEAGVRIDWMPSQGLEIDAHAALHAQPSFRFDVSGYVAVTVFGASLYNERIELAAAELGSGLEFGARFPITYREGQPFRLSLDDVEFDIPDVDPVALIHQLGAQLF